MSESSPAEKTPRKRGRPRAFKSDAALDAALKTFWRRGFDGTSLDDLTTAMDLNRPSVYAAFGNKDELYEAAVDRYVATIGAGYLAAFTGRRPLAKELGEFYAAVIDVVTGRHGPLGCVVACTMPAQAGVSKRARDPLANVLRTLDGAGQARVEAAVRAGELPRATDSKALAEVVTSGMLSISLRARAGASRRDLMRIARTFVAMVAAS